MQLISRQPLRAGSTTLPAHTLFRFSDRKVPLLLCAELPRCLIDSFLNHRVREDDLSKRIGS